MQVALDIFDGHGGVVDQNADRQRKAAQRHDVEGLAEKVQRHQGREDGQGDGDGDNERRPPVAEEDQDQRGGQSRRDQGFMDHAGDGGLDENRLVEQRPHFDFEGQEFFRARQQAFQIVDDAQGRGAEPVLSTDRSAPRSPSRRTILVCGEKPSRTCATSRR